MMIVPIKQQCKRNGCVSKRVNKMHCDSCRLDHNQRTLKNRHKNSDICFSKGCESKRNTKLFCKECQDKHNAYSIKHYKKRHQTNMLTRDLEKDEKRGIVKLLNVCRRDNELPEIKPKERFCLKCERSFTSIGDHNRLCEDCRDENDLQEVGTIQYEYA